MSAVGHSSLLKYLVADAKMSDSSNVKSEVPVKQNIREDGPQATLDLKDPDKDNQSVAVSDDGAEPVITITKHEATYTRGALKLQQVTITEHISLATSTGEELQNNDDAAGRSPSDVNDHDKDETKQILTEDEAADSRKTRTKIPMARLRKTVERVKTEIKQKRIAGKGEESVSHSRKTSIPRLRDSKIPLPKEANTSNDNSTNSNPDEEFDRIFQDMSPTDAASLEFVNTNVENVNQVEMKFEEIIHDYEESILAKTVNKGRHSKIPLLKRKSDHEIVIPADTLKNKLVKSHSLDPNKEQTQMVPKPEIIKDTKRTYTETKTEERFVLHNAKDTNINDNTVITLESTSVTSDIGSEHQEMNDDKEPITTFDLEVVNDKHDTVSKDLNDFVKIDKESVSKIYKIDFTVNNFDSIDSLKADAIDDSINHKVTDNHNELETGLDVSLADDVIKTKYSAKLDTIKLEEVMVDSKTQTDSNDSNYIDIAESAGAGNKFEINTNEAEQEMKANDDTVDTGKPSPPKYHSNYSKQTLINKDAEAIAKVDSTIFKDSVKKDINEDSYKIYSDVFTKLSVDQFKLHSNTIKGMNKLNDEQTNVIDIDNSMEEDIPILKGKVNRIIRRISSVDNSRSIEKDISDEGPKESILTKIAVFEVDGSNESLTRAKNYGNNNWHGLATQQTSAEVRRPKIVRGLLKDSNQKNTTEDTTEEMNLSKSKNANGAETAGTDADKNVITTDDKNNKKAVNHTIKYKQLVTNYKRVKDVINDIETKKYCSYENLQYEKYKVSKTDRYKCSKKTTGADDVKISDADNPAPDDNKADIPNGYQLGVPGPRNNEPATSNETYSYTKIYRHVSNGVDLDQDRKSRSRRVEGSVEDGSGEDLDETHQVVAGYLSIAEPVDNDGGSIEKDRSKGRAKETYRVRREEMKRATSLAEAELGNLMRGKVIEMVNRLNAMNRMERKDMVNTKERKKRSVTEKVALFEGRLLPTRTERKPQSIQIMSNHTSADVTEDYARKIEELKNTKYGEVNAKYLELSDSTKMPVMAVGTALLDKRIAVSVVEAAIEMGYRAIDAAYIYGNEGEVGRAISNKINDGTVKREELYIISKLWSTRHRRALVAAACRDSLAAMGLSYFDLYVIHNPISLMEGDDPLPKVANVLQYSDSDYMDAWRGIEDLLRNGLVRSGGVSNFNSKQIENIARRCSVRPVVNLVESHPYLSQQALARVCEVYGIKLHCYGVLGSKGTPPDLKSDVPPAIDDPLVVVMAAGLDITPGQLLVAYQVNSGRGVVVKSTSAAHLHDNLLAQHYQINSSHIAALNSLNRNKRIYTLKGFGETHRNYPFNIPF